VTAPANPKLPDGGGFPVSYYFPKPGTNTTRIQDRYTFASDYGDWTNYWHGVDATVHARLRRGLTLQFGSSTGRSVADNCDVVAKIDNPSTRFCHVETSFLTQVKFLGSYNVPKVDVQVSGTFQSIPGPQIGATYVATNAQVAPSLGRNLSGNAQNVSVALVEPGTMYGDRLNQVDLRVGKILKFGKTRTAVNLDLFNAFNRSTVLTVNNNYASWLQPLSIVSARLAKISVQFDF